MSSEPVHESGNAVGRHRVQEDMAQINLDFPKWWESSPRGISSLTGKLCLFVS